MPKEHELQKRQRTAAPVENTDTEPESDDWPIPHPAPAQLRAAASSSPDPLPRAGTEATPTQPSAPTAAPSRSHSLGGSLSHYGSPRLRYPDPDPPRNATHSRLRATLRLRELANMEIDDPDDSSLPGAQLQREPGPQTQTRRLPDARTYGGSRSHMGSGSQLEGISQSSSRHSNNPGPQSRPRSDARSDARAQVFARSRARAQPGARSQPSTHSRGERRPRESGQRRLDPVSQARADMVDFNRKHAQEHTNSLIQSITRRTERTARCTTAGPRLPQDLLDDDEEAYSHAAAMASGSHPVRFFYHFTPPDLTWTHM
jgi:hypothetical protein